MSRGGRPRIQGVVREPNGRVKRQSGQGDWVVYFVKEIGPSRVKIGFTNNLSARVSSIAIATSSELRIVATIQCDGERMCRRVEMAIHHALTQYGRLIRGEWFAMTAYEAEGVAAVCRERLAISKDMGDFLCGVIGREGQAA